MELLAWINEPGIRGSLVAQLYSDDPADASDAVASLAKRGWLTDGSLRGVDIAEANLPEADLHKADLKDANLRESNFAGADLRGAILADADCSNTDFSKSNLQDVDARNANFLGADFREAKLLEADLFGADLRESKFDGAILKDALLDRTWLIDSTVSDKQLAEAMTLAHALMPDGSLYDGRFNLEGDIFNANGEGATPDNSESMASYYGVPVAEYVRGQEWAAKNLPRKKRTRGERTTKSEASDDGDVTAGFSLETWSLSSYIDLMMWPFKNRKEVEEYIAFENTGHRARWMLGWLSAALLWLPGFVLYYAELVKLALTPSLAQLELPLVRSLNLLVLYVIGSILYLLAGLATTAAIATRRGQGSVFAVFAILIALLTFGGGSFFSGLALMIGFVIALTLAYVYGGRGSRFTLFWVTAFQLTTGVWLLVTFLFPQLPELAMVGTGYDPGEVNVWGIVFVVGRTLIAIGITYLLRALVRDHLLKWVGRRGDNSVIRELTIAYLISLGITALQSVYLVIRQPDL